jgi:hypothetical protein
VCGDVLDSWYRLWWARELLGQAERTPYCGWWRWGWGQWAVSPVDPPVISEVEIAEEDGGALPALKERAQPVGDECLLPIGVSRRQIDIDDVEAVPPPCT